MIRTAVKKPNVKKDAVELVSYNEPSVEEVTSAEETEVNAE